MPDELTRRDEGMPVRAAVSAIAAITCGWPCRGGSSLPAADTGVGRVAMGSKRHGGRYSTPIAACCKKCTGKVASVTGRKCQQGEHAGFCLRNFP